MQTKRVRPIVNKPVMKCRKCGESVMVSPHYKGTTPICDKCKKIEKTRGLSKQRKEEVPSKNVVGKRETRRPKPPKEPRSVVNRPVNTLKDSRVSDKAWNNLREFAKKLSR